MAVKIVDKAKHPYAFGFSKVSELRADERIASERQTPVTTIVKPPTYDELLAKIEALQMEINQLKAQPPKVNRKSSDSKKSDCGRMKLPKTRMIRGALHYSEGYVAELSGFDQSTIGRRSVRRGIPADTSEGGKYYPASQFDNLKNRKWQA